MTVHVTIPVDEAAKADLDAWADERGVSVGSMVAEAVEAYVADQRAMLAAIDKARASLDAGEGIPHEVVVAEMLARRAERARG